MNYRCNLICKIFLILFFSHSSVCSLPAPGISSLHLFDNLDVSVEKIKAKSTDISCTYTDLTSLCDSVVEHQKFLHSIFVADTDGVVQYGAGDKEAQSMTGINIKMNKWFSNVLQDKKNVHTEIVKIDKRKVLLKSWNTVDLKEYPGPFIVAVLIDLEGILMEFRGNSIAPVALLFNEQIIYESDWVNDVGSIIEIPKLNGIKIAFADIKEQNQLSVLPEKSANDRSMFLIITALALLVGISGIVSFLISQKSLSKLRDDAWLKLEEEKLSENEKEMIHKLAVSHVYCEVKRQVETHELENITTKVRGEIEESIRKSSARNEKKIPELHSA